MKPGTTHTFYVRGMHCKACVILTESEIGDLPYITRVKTDLNSNTVEVSGSFPSKNPSEIARELTTVVEKHGYTITTERPIEEKNISDFQIAIPGAIAFIALFLLFQKLGLVNIINSEEITYGTAFVVGIVASLSTCLAVVGGLLLSLSANYAKGGDAIRPQVMFHIGRLVSFFVLGGLIGLLGSAFQLTQTMNLIVSVVIAMVMFVLGVNLLDLFPWAKRFQFATPQIISKKALTTTRMTHVVTPILIGVVTFFLPCGFTQSMQIYTLSTGSFLSGALTMGAFALGTLPVLALMSFGSLTIEHGRKSRIFFRATGIIVIAFALFNLINSLVVVGIIPPIFNF